MFGIDFPIGSAGQKVADAHPPPHMCLLGNPFQRDRSRTSASSASLRLARLLSLEG